MKIIKPMKLGLLHRSYSFRQQHFQSVAALCFFQLSTSEVLQEMAQWKKVQESLGEATPLDIAMPKPKGEFLLAGSAHTPAGKPLPTMRVRARVGELGKQLQVTGNRLLQGGLMPLERASAPEPFTEMPLGLENAYGGEGYQHNPRGKGYLPRLRSALGSSVSVEMPNVEDPTALMTRMRQRPPSAGFGPEDIGSPERRKLAGTYDKTWREQHFPGYAPDIDWSLFNVAPEAQRLDRYWQGDESFCFEGLSADYPILEGSLPAVYARVFTRCKDAELEELPTELETLWFFPDQDLGLMLFRGYQAVSDPDAADVQELLLAYENRADLPRTLDHYRNVLALRTGDEMNQLAHAFNESQLSPAKSPEIQARDAAEVEAEVQRREQEQQQFVAELDLPEVPEGAEPLPTVDTGPVIPPEAVARGDVDLSELYGHIDQRVESVRADGDAALAELEQNPPPGGEPSVEEQRQRALAFASTQPRRFGGQGQPGAVASLDDMAAAGIDPQPFVDMGYDPSQEMDINAARRLAQQPIAPAAPLYPESRAALRQFVTELLAAGGTLAGRDLAGADLTGMDLTGVDMREVMLEQADLSHCRLAGADLSGVALTACILDGASFSGANLAGANLCRACARGADFSGADLSGAFINEASLRGCRFDGATLESALALKLDADGTSFRGARVGKTTLNQASLRHSDWRESSIAESFLLLCDLEGADFSGSHWLRTAAMKARARVANFDGASLDRVQMGADADFTGASFRATNASRCGFRDTDFRVGDFREANFEQCDFGECDLGYASFRSASLTESVLSGADLSHADLRELRLLRGMARNSVAREADFSGADFYGTNLQYATWTDCELEGSRNLADNAMELAS